MRDFLAFLLVLLSGAAVLCAFVGIMWPVYAWLVGCALVIAPVWNRRHGR